MVAWYSVGCSMMNLNDPAHRGHSNHLISTDGRTARRVWVPDLPILETVKNELIQICQSHANERCGFIDSYWDIHDIPNIHEEPRHNFYMSDDGTAQVLKKIYEEYEEHVIAMWHTHPNNVPWPSPRDLRGWPNPELGWRYLIVTNDDVLEWELVT